jgi:group I intron endonuclease
MSNISGIYKIQSISHPERCYIGSAVDITDRWRRHLKRLDKNNHHSHKLQRHYSKYGKEDLVFSIITPCDREDLKPIKGIIRPEQFFIWAYDPYFNECKTAGSVLGYHWTTSDEHKRKLSIANKVPHPERKKPVLQYDFQGNFIKEWLSVMDIEQVLHISHTSIGSCCLYRINYNSAGGFMWKYKVNNLIPNKIDPFVKNRGNILNKVNGIRPSKKIILQFDKQENFIKEWESAAQVRKELFVNSNNIISCCKNIRKFAGDFIWKYKEIKNEY